MAVKKKKATKSKTVVEKKEEIKKVVETKVEEVEKPKQEEKKKVYKKGIKVIANGRCFGASCLECPLKSVKNYETLNKLVFHPLGISYTDNEED